MRQFPSATRRQLYYNTQGRTGRGVRGVHGPLGAFLVNSVGSFWEEEEELGYYEKKEEEKKKNEKS